MSNPANPLLRLRALPDLRLRRARLRELVLGGEDDLLQWLGEVVVCARDGDGDAALTVVASGSLLVQAASEAELTEALAGLLAAWLAEASDEGEEEDGEPPCFSPKFLLTCGRP